MSTLRKRIGGLLFRHGLTSLAYAGKLHPNARPHRHGIELLSNVPYLPDGDPAHLLDIYQPRRLPAELHGQSATYGPPYPVVLYIHGGAFRILSKDTHWVFGLALARRGMLVFNVNYRLAPRHPFPAALDDLSHALRFVVTEARRLGGDPSRLILAGESAGANLATALALSTVVRSEAAFARRAYDLGCVPRVILPMCGILQVSDAERFSRRKKLPTWLQDRLTETAEAYLAPHNASEVAQPGAPAIDRAFADPLLVLERYARGELPWPADRVFPACFASCGTRDPLLDDTRRLGRALQSLGVPSETGIYPGELHAFQALVFRAQARRCWADTYAFLQQHV